MGRQRCITGGLEAGNQSGPPRFDPDEVRRFREATPVEGLEIFTPPPTMTTNGSSAGK